MNQQQIDQLRLLREKASAVIANIAGFNHAYTKDNHKGDVAIELGESIKDLHEFLEENELYELDGDLAAAFGFFESDEDDDDEEFIDEEDFNHRRSDDEE